MNTVKTLDVRIEDLVHEIKEIQKELILERMARVVKVKERTTNWSNLCEKASALWDGVSASDEITAQREKSA